MGEGMKSKGGRKPGEDMNAALEYGVRKRLVIVLGGAAKLRAMDEAARNVLLGVKRKTA